MSMVSEAHFHGLVAAWLRDSFADVEHEPTIESGREPDFVVHTPFQSYVLEIENTFDDIYNGVGQAAVYSVEMGLERIVVVPADTIDEPDLLAGLQAAPWAPHIATV